jgi:peptide chain release factor 1
MIDRLAELEARHGEVGRQLATPEVASDPSQLAHLGRELARLDPIVAAIREWRAVRDELEGARAMVDDPDEEMRAMARDEVARLSARAEELESSLRLQLVPTDPNDERDVIVGSAPARAARRRRCSRPTCSGCTPATPSGDAGRSRS